MNEVKKFVESQNKLIDSIQLLYNYTREAEDKKLDLILESILKDINTRTDFYISGLQETVDAIYGRD